MAPGAMSNQANVPTEPIKLTAFSLLLEAIGKYLSDLSSAVFAFKRALQI